MGRRFAAFGEAGGVGEGVGCCYAGLGLLASVGDM